MKQVKWFDREFHFQSTQNIFPSIIERLWGTPLRLDAKMKSVPDHLLSLRVENSWTIKENIGHLTDLEPLWQGRLDDILTGKETLRVTDLQNTRTTEANHDATNLDMLLENFRKIRMDTLLLLEKLTEEQIFMSALHPRLKTPMRVMDHFLFVAEHDDHHLSRITQLAQLKLA